jgi:hypothetical protein
MKRIHILLAILALAISAIPFRAQLRRPVDFRTGGLPATMPDVPAWTPELYDSIKQELNKLEPFQSRM